MNNKLAFLFLLLIFCVNGLSSNEIHSNHVKKSKFTSLISKPLTTNLIGNESVSDGPFCQSIVAFYVGTLQNKHAKQSFDVEFQVRLNADPKKKHIHIQADRWEEKFSNSSGFELDFYYDGSRQWCDIYDDGCSVSFAKKETSFKLDLNTANGNYFHLLNFNYFNNTFGLVKPRGKCTKHQLSDLNDDYTPDLDELSFCVCCDDYKPDELLGCPNDKWIGEATTLAPVQKTTPEPKQENVTCKEVVGYYNGIFQNTNISSILNTVEFQSRLVANDVNQRISFTVDCWNGNKANMTDLVLYSYNYENNTDWYGTQWMGCSPITNSSCSIKFVTKERPSFKVFFNHFTKGTYDNWYIFMYFPNFNNAFTLTNTIGHCTKTHLPTGLGFLNSTLFEYCVCCGDKYDPDPRLECPKNPWA